MNIPKLRDPYRNALVNDVIPFWLRHSPDHDHGRPPNGDFNFAVDRTGKPFVQPYSVFSDCFATMALAQYGQAARAADVLEDQLAFGWD